MSLPSRRTLSSERGASIERIFDTMEYGPAVEDDSAMHKWLDSHDRRFGLFIDGEWVHGGKSGDEAGRSVSKSYAPATGDQLAFFTEGTNEDVDRAVAAAAGVQKQWAETDPHDRARHLYAIARHIQKHSRLISVVESMENGKTIRETRDVDVPLAVRHFYHHAGWAQIMDKEMPDHEALGVVAQIIPWNFPFLMLAWKIAPAIAMGNTVVLKPAPQTRLSAMLFCDILAEAGLPPGVVNIVTGPTSMATHLLNHPQVDKVAFTGSTEVGQLIRRQIAGTGKKLTLELGGKSPVVVFDSADLDSAVEGIVQAIFFNQGQVCCAGSRLLVQENVAPAFVEKIKARMQTLRVGHSLDKCLDMGAVIDGTQRETIDRYVELGREEGNEIYQIDVPGDDGVGMFYPPTLVTNVHSASTLVQEEIFGPVLTVQTFRTPAEAASLANNSKYGLGASVWTENVGLAMETAMSIRSGTVWINAHNMFDASAGFGGMKESGYGREGGREGLYAYLKPFYAPKIKDLSTGDRERMIDNASSWGKADMAIPSPRSKDRLPSVEGGNDAVVASSSSHELASTHHVDRTPKMYIGGKQKRPDQGHVRPVIAPSGTLVGQVGDGNRKDVRDAVEAAWAAFPKWGKRSAHDRSQICFYTAENLAARRSEFAATIRSMTDRTAQSAEEEVDLAISRLFTYAAYADKYGGEVQEGPLYGLISRIHEPVGVIGIACPTEYPLLGFVSLVAPAVVRGNTVVAVPSEDHPLSATDLYQVLDTSDLPGGVVNIVTGARDVLTKTLVDHQHVDSMWYHATGDVGVEGSFQVEHRSAINMKRTFVSYGHARDWASPIEGEGLEFLQEATEVKNVWVPMGEQYGD